MNLLHALKTYLTLNALIAVGALGLLALGTLIKRSGLSFGASAKLKLNYQLLFAVIFIALLQPFLPVSESFLPAAKVWSAPSQKLLLENSVQTQQAYIGLPLNATHSSISENLLASILLGLIALTSLGGLWKIWRDLQIIAQIRQQSYLVRRIGRVRIYLSDATKIPFSYRAQFADIILPSSLLQKNADLKIALLHELQHHRQRDTLWLYGIRALQSVCALNPFVYFWSRSISEIQEFACDEVLIGRKKVTSREYARCLVEVAQTAIAQERVPVCATGFAFMSERKILKRRIEKMIHPIVTPKKRIAGSTLAATMILLLTAAAFASNNMIHDRRVSLAQAQEMAEAAKSSDAFPIVVNDLVLTELNRYISTPDGREFMRESIVRMQTYKAMIGKKLEHYRAPTELFALPVVETGYQNRPQDPQHESWGAGLWSFIESTARNYGLKVNGQVDERLNPELLTDAAIRYLSSNHARFDDWQLAILAYNVGEQTVQRAITSTGSRDAWVLIHKGIENDKNYLAKVMATVLILKNPDVVK